jgi:hypothetical protein
MIAMFPHKEFNEDTWLKGPSYIFNHSEVNYLLLRIATSRKQEKNIFLSSLRSEPQTFENASSRGNNATKFTLCEKVALQSHSLARNTGHFN